jgi:uncharacterized protein YndB with AHSA1/START domain
MSTSRSVTVVMEAPADRVWAAIADVTRIGEWSPECVAGRWVDGATGPAVGARFEGDNEARVAGRVVKRWTTTSLVTACEPGREFAFVAEGYTTWRYVLSAEGDRTSVTESFEYVAAGLQGLLYDTVLMRPRAMAAGMHRTLERIKAAVER